MILKTKRLWLRPLTDTDYPYFLDFITDKEATQYLGLALTSSTPEEIFAALLTTNSLVKQTYAIVHQTLNHYIGYVGYEYMQEEQEIHVHWTINRTYWRQGYAKESMDSLLEQLPRPVYAYIHPLNYASKQLATSLKMTCINTIELIPAVYAVDQFKLD